MFAVYVCDLEQNRVAVGKCFQRAAKCCFNFFMSSVESKCSGKTSRDFFTDE